MDCGRDRRRFRDRSNLPSEIVEEIILKIDFPEDVIRFSSVCHEWLAAFREVRSKWRPLNPWLLLCENAQDNVECLRKVYNPGNNKCYSLKLPETFGKNCWGSDCGWIVTYGLDLQLTMFNPLTKACIGLPPTDTMMSEMLIGEDHCEINNTCKYKAYWMRKNHILRACVLKTNENECDGGLLVAVIHTHKRYYGFVHTTYLSVAKPGDTRWTLIETPREMKIHDVLFYKDLLYFVDEKCGMWYVDVNKGGPVMELQIERHQRLDCRPIKYLVDLGNQQLCLVQRHYLTGSPRMTITITRTKNGIPIVDPDKCPLNDKQITYIKSNLVYTQRFKIFKLDLSSKRWKFVDDLPSECDQSSLFLGKSTGLVVSAPKSGTCQARRIYYAGDHVCISGHDMGVRDVCFSYDEMPAKFYHGTDTNSDVCNPFWFTPLL
ncbi:hypothetical protein RND81_12G034400 [Saponaria officinalis]|uniref:F-box domain-containing protein n=1 Tax=Saponaria officinalis TaxID=3572 RepID=A0AAW1H514_SAPOF